VAASCAQALFAPQVSECSSSAGRARCDSRSWWGCAPMVLLPRVSGFPHREEGWQVMQSLTREEYEEAYASAMRRAEQKAAYRERHAQWVERVLGRARGVHVAAASPKVEPVRRCTGCGAWEHLERPCACGGGRR